MVLLTVFALVAGAATAISPCVLPVLPALLGAGATGGRRRPLGIVIGLAVTFTATIVGFASVIDGVGLGNDVLRDLAIAVLAVVGLVLLVPAVAARVEARLSRVARFGPRSAGDGFWSGLGVGAALGFVYTPCAGPILAAVIAASATTGKTVVIGTAYAIGSAVVLLGLALLGRRLLTPLRQGNRMANLQRGIGVVMLLTAVAMAFELDIRFQERIADSFGSFNIANGLESSAAVQSRLTDLRGKPKFVATKPGTPSDLPVLGKAPEFTGTQRWFNSPPLTMAGLRGKVVLIDFWTYSCINCIRTLPYLKAWDAKYRDDGLVIVGVHAPEFAFEKDAGNVARAIASDGLKYPIVQDNDLATWQAWGNNVWPAEYLVDAQGRVRSVHLGEGEYDRKEADIRALLAESGAGPMGGRAQPRGVVTPTRATTPETYVGAARAEGFTDPPTLGTRAYTAVGSASLRLNQFTLGGVWTVGPQAARAGIGATLSAKVHARDVYLVLGGPGRLQVSVDGGLPRTLTIRRHRLYTLAHFAKPETHVLTLRPQSGVAAYAFTFG